MNSIQYLNKIKIQLNEINAINERLLSENSSANSIDIALLKKHCVELYESVLKLKAAPQNEIIETPQPIIETIVEPNEKVEIREGKVEQKVVNMEDFEIKEAAIIGTLENEIQIHPVNEIPEVVLEEIKIVEDEKLVSPFFTETIIEKKSNLINLPQSELSLHQKISGNKQNDINERINESRVESLKSAIGLNKKIAFVNDLFKENTVEYAKAIDKLNASIDLNEAMRFFNELKHQYSWTNDNENVVDLEQLIQKRFR